MRYSTLEHAYQLVQDLDRSQDFSFTKCTDYKDNSNKTTDVKSQPSQSRSCFGSSNSARKHDDNDREIYSESSKSVQQDRCFKCQGFGHIVVQCSSKTRTMIIETQSHNDHDDLEKIVHDLKEIFGKMSCH